MGTIHRFALPCSVHQPYPTHRTARPSLVNQNFALKGIQRHITLQSSKFQALPKLGSRLRHVVRRSRAGSCEDETTAAPATSPLQSFLLWLIANGVEGVGDGSSAALYEGESGERGIVAVQDIAEGDLVFRIPMRLALSDFPGNETSEGLVYEGAPWSVRLASRLLRERALGSASPWFPYLQVLPEMVPSPLQSFQWDDFKEVQYEPSQRALHSLNWLISDSFLRLSEEGRGGATETEFQWAVSVVHSRSFGSAAKEGGVGVRMMVPLVDMLNHGGDEVDMLLIDPHEATDTVRWVLIPPDTASSGAWEMEVRAVIDIEAGMELLLSYGERSADDFFLHYGFVPPRNPHDDVIIFQGIEEALQWHRTRFPIREGESEESLDLAYAVALQTAVAEGCIRSDVPYISATDADTAAHIKLMAGCRVDSGLAAAYSSLQGSRFGVPPTEVVVANRSEELLSQFPTGLLADLRVLAFHAGLPSETRHYKELLQYYTNEGLILAGYPQGMSRQMASRDSEEQKGSAEQSGESNGSRGGARQPSEAAAEGQSSKSLEELPGQTSEGQAPLSAAHELALCFRTQKKMMLWDVLIAHEKALAEKQAAMNSAA